MLFIPHHDMRKSAEALELVDLKQTILSCRDWILEENGLISYSALAKYGLICSNIYRGKTGKEVTKQKFFMTMLIGMPEFPDDLIPYHKAHQSFLSMLGWTRYLGDAIGYGPEDLAQILEHNRDGKSLLKAFKALVPVGYDAGDRPYKDFDVYPGAPKLWPSSPSTPPTQES